MTAQDAIHALWTASMATPVDLKADGTRAIALDPSLSGIFALYLKTKTYHWHGNILVALNPRPRRTNNQGD